MAADLARALVIFPAGAYQVAANHTLHRKDFRAARQHGAATQNLFVTTYALRHLVNTRRHQVMRSDVRQPLEPEARELSQDFALARNRSRQHAVEGRDAVSRHD